MLRFNGRKHEYLMKTVEIVQFESTFQIDRLEINNELSHFDVKSLFIFLVGLGIKEHIFQLEDLS